MVRRASVVRARAVITAVAPYLNGSLAIGSTLEAIIYQPSAANHHHRPRLRGKPEDKATEYRLTAPSPGTNIGEIATRRLRAPRVINEQRIINIILLIVDGSNRPRRKPRRSPSAARSLYRKRAVKRHRTRVVAACWHRRAVAPVNRLSAPGASSRLAST